MESKHEKKQEKDCCGACASGKTCKSEVKKEFEGKLKKAQNGEIIKKT